jgi:Cu(I)/Ag(I) efflux system membrane fusion protein
MMQSHFAARVLSALSVLAMSSLFVIGGVGVHPSSAFAQEKPSASSEKVNVTLTTDPSPAQKGTNAVRVKLTDAAGQPITGAAVTVTFSMPAMPSMNMAAMNTITKTTDKGAGMYEGKADLGSGGMWQVTISAQRNSQTIATKKLTIKATGGI